MLWLFSLLAFASAQCPGGYREGQILEQDPYWYRCSNQKMTPGGCMDDYRNRVGPNEMFDGLNYAWLCKRAANGMALEMAACLKDGQRVMPGRVLEDRTYWYSCERSGNWLTGKIGGCLHNGRRLRVEETVREDSNVLKCLLTPDGKAQMSSVGCLFNGREYKVGETFEDGQFFYSCRRRNGRCEAQTLGCTYKDRKVAAFENYYKDDQLFRCLFTQDLTKAKHVLEGCVKTDSYTGLPLERKLGCVWEDGQPPYVYLSECHNSTGKAEITRIRCKYEGPEGVAEVMPGCWSELGNLGVGCKQDPVEGMKIVTFNAKDESQIHYHGLKYWLDNLGACVLFRKK